MNRFYITLFAVMSLPFFSPARMVENFDSGWKFFKGDAPGAEESSFDDTSWRKLDLPHDWSIEGPFAETNKTGGAGAFLPSGVAWYRKEFSLPTNVLGQRVFIEFDGVMQNSDVWINGHLLGHRPNGYISFSYELTNTALNFGPGAENVLAVRCDTSEQPASRWYSGAGIYRHVRLVTLSPVHFAEHGVFISTPDVSKKQAVVQIEYAVANESGRTCAAAINTTLIAPDGKMAGSSSDFLVISNDLPAGNSFKQQIIVTNPHLWDLGSPKTYRAVSRIFYPTSLADSSIFKNKVMEEDTNTFGIRSAEFTPTNGFVLNGQKVVLKGVCLHHDGGAFGAAVPLSIWEQRLKSLRALGVNAIRTAHNPVAPEFLDLCDRMGFLVMDEFFDCWTRGKNPFDYHLYFDQWAHADERDTILRDRNHPSVIIYSVGNEIHDTSQPEKAKGILSNLVAVAHAADPTRPVTQALFRPNKTGDYTNGLADLLDVIGTNYRDLELLAARRAKPARKIVNTEQKHTREAWLGLCDNPALAGQFLWVGVDYLGEARSWPRISYAGGLLDRTGRPKPSAFERQSWWSATPMVRIVRRTAANDPMPGDPGFGEKEMFTQVQFTDWTPKNSGPHEENVEVYSNCKEVELLLNNKSLGKREINADASPRNWNVPFAPGTLKALARDEKGTVVATDELKTAGAPAKIVLSTETSQLALGFDNVAIVRAKITDADGIEIPRASDLISFGVSGHVVIAAVDNGDNDSHENFQATQRHAFQGGAVAFVKGTGLAGQITVTATAAGLKPGTITILTN